MGCSEALLTSPQAGTAPALVDTHTLGFSEPRARVRAPVLPLAPGSRVTRSWLPVAWLAWAPPCSSGPSVAGALKLGRSVWGAGFSLGLLQPWTVLQALERAEGKYKRLNAAAMAVTRPGGLLMTCSCSGAVAQGTGLLPILQARQTSSVIEGIGVLSLPPPLLLLLLLPPPPRLVLVPPVNTELGC